MRITIAPDSFKGALSSIEIANAMEEGIKKALPNAKITKVPMADGGMGMAQALGVRFFDKEGNKLGFGGIELKKIEQIDMSELHPMVPDVEIQVACDVKNPLCGEKGAAYVFGPQKGAGLKVIRKLDEGLRNFSSIIQRDLDKEIEHLPGAGAAGGLGGGLVAFLNAKLESGVQMIIRANNLEEKIKNADLVFTGEGKTDEQTILGKVPVGVARVAKRHNVPVVCLSGALTDGVEKLYDYGITALFSVINKDMNLKEAMDDTYRLVKSGAENLVRLVKASNKK